MQKDELDEARSRPLSRCNSAGSQRRRSLRRDSSASPLSSASQRRNSLKKETDQSPASPHPQPRRSSVKKDSPLISPLTCSPNTAHQSPLTTNAVKNSPSTTSSPKTTSPKNSPFTNSPKTSPLTSNSASSTPKKSPLASSYASSTPKKSPLASSYASSTPKKSVSSTGRKNVKNTGLEFMVTGKQITKRSDRANSLPGSYHRRPSDHPTLRGKKGFESPKRDTTQSSKDTSLEEDMSLDLSQVSDFEDTSSKYGIPKLTALATSTPKPRVGPKPRSASLQSHMQRTLDTSFSSKRSQQSRDSLCSRDSLYKTPSSASPYRYGTGLDYSSVSPEYSGQSSVELSPRAPTTDLVLSPVSQRVASCSVSTWQDCSPRSAGAALPDDGEWSTFWANYNNSVGKVPVKSYYDQCPTPYRTEGIDLNDFDFSTEGSRKRSPDNIKNINDIICNEGLQLTPRETQNIIKCTHILGNVLSKAIERRTREKDAKIDDTIDNKAKIDEIIDDPREIKKKTLSLNLTETVLPLEVKEEKRSESVTTQTDISLPNTKSAPRIFEKILRQLSRSSIDEGAENTRKNESPNEAQKEN